MDKKYITTAIAYVNGAPHIGHALEFIQADAFSRFFRMKGFDLHFLTGTDEHGQKVYETAKNRDLDVQEFVDKNAQRYLDFDDKFDISYDAFVRTTDENHKKAAQKLWQKLVENDDIYKASYEGRYCVGCELYLTERDLDEDGNCLIHKKAPQIHKEENYFFRLSKYSDKIKELIEKDKFLILPKSRKNEFLNMLGDGLKDVSFSRSKESLSWGVTASNDENHVMYVWCDALANYLSAIGYGGDFLQGRNWVKSDEDFSKYWPADLQIIGKDILRFHAGIWPGILLAAGLPLPKTLMVHGFVTGEGEKMSKTRANVVDPFEIADKYGVDALRYYLLKEIPTLDDGDFSISRFEEVYNSELKNGFGNLLNRVLMMVERYLEGKVPDVVEDSEFSKYLDKILVEYQEAFESYDIKMALERVKELVDYSNKYIDDTKPWALFKEEQYDELKKVLYLLLESLKLISICLKPIIPETSRKIAEQLGLIFEDIDFNYKWGNLSDSVSKGDYLFSEIAD